MCVGFEPRRGPNRFTLKGVKPIALAGYDGAAKPSILELRRIPGTARVGRWTGMAGCLGRFPQLVVPGPTARENRRTLANDNRECQDWDEEVAGPAKQSVSEAGEVMMKR